MKLLICAGGTGGGVYPALAVLQALRNNAPMVDGKIGKHSGGGFETLWVGGVGGMEAELVKRARIEYQEIPAAGVHGVGLRTLPGNTAKLVRGYRQSQHILESFRPDVLFFTGGYIAVPMALAGRRYASLVFAPDIEPGLALRTIARFASKIAVTVEESRAYYQNSEKVIVTGYPTRTSITEWTTRDALGVFQLDQEYPVLLVFGGSKGARSINQALLAGLPELLDEMQIIHISGALDWEQVDAAKARLSEGQLLRYRAFPYLHDRMGAAFRAADLVLSRAGASTLGEFPAFGLPAILVPYPHAWRYQKVNAQYLVDRGAAKVIADQSLQTELVREVLDLVRDRAVLEQMAQAMSSLAATHAAQQIASSLIDLANHAHKKRM